MGQKVNPVGFRIGINKDWSSQWITGKDKMAKYIKEDNTIRKFIKKKYSMCNIASIDIERNEKKVVINVFTSRPGMIIGNKGSGIDTMKNEIRKLSDTETIMINIREVKRPELDAVLVAEDVANQLEKRVAFTRAVKQALQRIMKAGAKGAKIMVSGRLNGNDIARSEIYKEGSLPLQTIRSDIDYGTAESHTTFGIVGVKVWIYKGEILRKKNVANTKSEQGGRI